MLESGVQAAMLDAAYAMFALQQPLELTDLVDPQSIRSEIRFPMGSASTPEWFAAAASGSDLTEMAPELRATQNTDLIHMYGEGEEVTPPRPSPEPSEGGEVQWGLLKQIADLDS